MKTRNKNVKENSQTTVLKIKSIKKIKRRRTDDDVKKLL